MLYAAVNLRRDHGTMALGVGAAFAATDCDRRADPRHLAAAAWRRRRDHCRAQPVLRRDPRRRSRRLRPAAVDRDLSLGHRNRVAGGAAADHGQRHRQLHSARRALLHSRRPRDGTRRHQHPAGALHLRPGRPYEGRPASGHRRQHVCRLGIVRLEARRRRRRRHRDARRTRRTPRRGRRRRRSRRCRRDGRNRSSQHRHADRRLDHQRVGRRHVHRRPDPGRRDGALPDGADLCPRPRQRGAAHAARQRAPSSPVPGSARSCRC